MSTKCFLIFLLYVGYCLAVPTGEGAKSADSGKYPRILRDYLALNHLIVETNAEGKRLLFHKQKTASYFDAINVCKMYDMELIRIDDEAKTKFLSDLMEKYTRGGEGPFWMSGSRLDDNQTWKWTNGDPITYFNWAGSEPNNAKLDEKCIELYIAKVAWNDERCTIRNGFICESRTPVPQSKEDNNKLSNGVKEGHDHSINEIDSNFNGGDKRIEDHPGKSYETKEYF